MTILEAPASLRLRPEELRRNCDPDSLGFETTAEVPPLEGTVGQDRAIHAIEFALNVTAPGYNLYVAGYPGTGRNTALRAYLERLAATRPVPPDLCYVHNFHDPQRPQAVMLPAGRGREFASVTEKLVEDCKRAIPRAFESDAYNQRREELSKEFQRQRDELFAQLEAEAKRLGFGINATPVGIAAVPLVDNRPMTREEFEQLPEELRKRIQEVGEHLESHINQTVLQGRRIEKEARAKLEELDRQVARFVLEPLVQEVREQFTGIERVQAFYDHLLDDIIEHLEVFRPQEQQPVLPFPLGRATVESVTARYQVNVIVSNEHLKGAPVVIENSPTYYNLFGRVEYRAQLGAMVTDHMQIRSGAVHRANGGFLVVQAFDLLTSFMAWDALKRTLRSREVRIENLGEQFVAVPSASLAPEPVPVDVKVVMVGNPAIYHVLFAVDEDFRKLFKVKSDFGLDMDRTPENERQYAAFVSNRTRELGLRPFHKTAVAELIEYGSRLVEHQNKLSTRFIDIADLLVEADYWAARAGSGVVMGEHVQEAIEQKIYRSNLIEERIQELIEDGTILIDTAGAKVGQVNGISVYDLGDYRFGRPSRITARVSLGRGALVNIEREIQMSGKIHSKGFAILSGYLHGKYGAERTLAFSASIGFEQVYDEVEGDSASAAELYALLSALSGVPLKQGLAVTGSVNQLGQVQAVGGVAEKVEGFYAVCKARGLTGEEGVILPRDNVKHLMLKPEVVEAVRQGRFNVWGVSTVEEGMEILTGMPMGEPGPDGVYPEGTLNRRIVDRLEELAKKAREHAARAEGKEEGEGEEEKKDGEKAAESPDSKPEPDKPSSGAGES